MPLGKLDLKSCQKGEETFFFKRIKKENKTKQIGTERVLYSRSLVGLSRLFFFFFFLVYCIVITDITAILWEFLFWICFSDFLYVLVRHCQFACPCFFSLLVQRKVFIFIESSITCLWSGVTWITRFISHENMALQKAQYLICIL